MADERIERLRRAAAQGDVDAQARAAYERWRLAPSSAMTSAAWSRVIARVGAAAWTPAVLSGAQLRALETDLAPLDGLRSGHASSAVAFVLTGHDDGVLFALASDATRADEALKLKTSRGRTAPRDVFLAGEPASAAFLLRLGTIYDAARAETAWRPRLLAPALGWLESLVWEAGAASNLYSMHRLEEPMRISILDLETALRLGGFHTGWVVRLGMLRLEHGHDMLLATLLSARGFGEALQRHAGLLRRGFVMKDAETRARAFELIARGGADPGPWADAIVRAAAQDGAGVVRRAAAPLVKALGDRAREPLTAQAASSRSKKLKAAVAALVADLPAAVPERPRARGRAAEARAALRDGFPQATDAELDALLATPEGRDALFALGRPFERREGGDLVLAADALARAGIDPDGIGALALDARGSTFRPFSAQRWTRATEYYATRTPLIVSALRGLPAAVGSWRRELLAELAAVLDALDPLPAALLEPLIALALGHVKGDRAMARARLARVPGIRAHVEAARDATKKKGVREQAEAWLAELPRGRRT